MTRKRIMAIGLEAAEPSLIEQWAREGHLPTIASLMQQGAYTRITNSAELACSTTWSSISCGVKPGKHGMAFCHRQLKSGTYEVRKKGAGEAGRTPFWVALDHNGKSIAIMDVPETKCEDMKGLQIVCWGLDFEAWPTSSTPKGLIKEINKKYGAHPLKNYYQRKCATKEEWKALAEKVIEGAKKRISIWKDILSRKKYEFSLLSCAETHLAAHFFWHIHDTNHPDHDPDIARYVGDPILDVYKLFDAAIAEFRAIDPDAVLAVWSNTGMGPNYSGRHFVQPVLKKLGYYYSNDDKKKQPRFLPAADVYSLETIEKLVRIETIMFIKKLIPTILWDGLTRRFLNMGSTWAKSRAFDIPGDNTGTIRLNLKGREPSGLLDPAEYNTVSDDIAKAFIELKDPDTGNSVVSDVIRVREKYSGDHDHDFPDLVIKWNGTSPITKICSDRVGLIERDHLPDKRSGAHTDQGFFLIAGKGIRRQASLNGQMYIWDIAPTLLYLMGEEIPDDMDGIPQTSLMVVNE
ncbi:MAG: alkaline phosphatase family protein [Candidatus Omnitrophica bacterium]|nr:alkaline phosphatase family protein [Candidatus Omnitrophota bacterium]